jgi:hypothetical protein
MGQAIMNAARASERVEAMRVQLSELEDKRPGVLTEPRLPKWAQQARLQRPAVKAKFGKLFEEVSAILFRHDPVHINYGSNTDEYDPEVGTILPRLKQCRSAEDVQAVVFDEFGRWFGLPGEQERYGLPSQEIWSAWRRFKNTMR